MYEIHILHLRYIQHYASNKPQLKEKLSQAFRTQLYFTHHT